LLNEDTSSVITTSKRRSVGEAGGEILLRLHIMERVYWDPALEGLGKFSHLENHSKISNLVITELFFSGHIF